MYAESIDIMGGMVYNNVPGFVLQGESNGILRYHCLACRCVGSHKHTVLVVKVENGLLLEWIQFKWKLKVWKSKCDVVCNIMYM